MVFASHDTSHSMCVSMGMYQRGALCGLDCVCHSVSLQTRVCVHASYVSVCICMCERERGGGLIVLMFVNDNNVVVCKTSLRTDNNISVIQFYAM